MTFYNPICDLWQGMERISSYASAFPISFVQNDTFETSILNLNIKMHDNPDENMFGLRAYSTSVTFIFDTDNKNLLEKSNENCPKIMPVSKGSQYRTTNTIFEYDDINTGFNYQMAYFDNERKKIDFKYEELLQTLLQKEHKNYQTIAGNMLISMHNLWTNVQLMPGYGTCGLLIKAGPSLKYNVSSIHITYNLELEHFPTDRPHFYKQFQKLRQELSVNLTTNLDKIISTGKVDVTVEANLLQTNYSLKAQISRMIPDKEPWLMSIEGEKQWLKNSIVGNLNISIENATEECKKNDKRISVKVEGQKSNEQLNAIQKIQKFPEECQFVYKANFKPHLPVKCIEKYTSYRKYNYEIKVRKSKQEDEKITKINVEFPMESNNMNIYYDNNNNLNKSLNSIPGFSILGLHPDNYFFDSFYIFWKPYNKVISHIIYYDSIRNTGGNDRYQTSILETNPNSTSSTDYYIQRNVTYDEILIFLWDGGYNCINNTNCHTRCEGFIKEVQLDDGTKEMRFRLVLSDNNTTNTLSISGGKATFNGEPLPQTNTLIQHYAWFSFGTISDTFIVDIQQLGIYIDFNGDYIRIYSELTYEPVMGLYVHF